MKLKSKLNLISVAVLLIPTIITLTFVLILFDTTNRQTTQNGLTESFELVQHEIIVFENETLESAKTLAGDDYIKDKLYVYSKYWDYMGTQSLEYDLQILENTLNDYLITSSFDSVGIYRIAEDSYEKIISFGDDLNMTNTIVKNPATSTSSIQYEYFNNNIYMITRYPIFQDGAIVGMMLIRNRLDSSFIKKIAVSYNLDLVVIRNQSVLLSTFEDFNSAYLTEEEDYFSKVIDDKRYAFYRDRLLDDSIPIDLFIIRAQDSLFEGMSREIIILIGISMFCLFFPAVILTFWGRNLINGLDPLSRGASKIRQNDYSYRIEGKKRKDEIGTLYSLFNSMTGTIARDRSIMEDRNRTLGITNSYIEAVFNILLVSVVIVNKENTVLLVNDSGKKELFKTDQSDIYGHDLYRIRFFSDNRETLESSIRECSGTGTHTKTDEISWDDSIYAVEMFPLSESLGEEGIIFVILNITESVQMERAVIQSERLAVVGKLSAAMAHEINNPMGILLNHVQLLQTGKLSEEQQEIFLSRMESEITRVNKLIKSLLDYGKASTQEFKVLNLGELIHQVCTLFDLKFARKGVEVTLPEESEETLFISGDKDQLKQVFFNIINNAIQAIPKETKGSLEINYTDRDTEVDIHITDNGIGMSQDTMDHMFDDFFSSKGDDGIGLGLAVTKQIVKKHEGKITVTSEQGEGTTFTITLPLVAEGDNKRV